MRFEAKRFTAGCDPELVDHPMEWAVEGVFFDADEDYPEGKHITVGFSGARWRYTTGVDPARESLDALSVLVMSGLEPSRIEAMAAELPQSVHKAYSEEA